jgi:phage tail-like protein
MSVIFPANATRFDPYKLYAFLVYFDKSTTPVAGLSKVTGIKRSTDPIEYKEGGNALSRFGPARTKYDTITMERGMTQNRDFETWANAVQALDKSVPTTSLKELRRTLRIVMLSEQYIPVHAWTVYRCWVSEYQAIPDLDAGSNAVAIEHIKLQHEGWEHESLQEQPET